MSIKLLRPDQQSKLLDTLEEASELSKQCDPSIALAKAAKHHGLPENLLAYAVTAYNNGQTVATIKCGSTREEKSSTIPLANLEKVIAAIYPDRPVKKASVSPEYQLKPELLLSDFGSVKKSASRVSRPAPAPTPLTKLVDEVKLARDEVGQKFALYKKAQHDIQDYLENVRHMRLTELVDQSATAFGDLANVVLEPLSDPYAGHKSARVSNVVRVSQKPFNIVKEAIDRLESLYASGLDCGRKEEVLSARLTEDENSECPSTKKVAQLIKSELFPSPKVKPVTPVNKQAFDVGKSLLPKPKAEAAKKQPDASAPANRNEPVAPGRIYEPVQAEELGALNSSVAFNSLLRSDNDFRSYPKDQLTRAFNEIQLAFPAVASNPVTLRPFLQRHLAAGGLDDFALKNLADQERTLSQARSLEKS